VVHDSLGEASQAGIAGQIARGKLFRDTAGKERIFYAPQGGPGPQFEGDRSSLPRGPKSSEGEALPAPLLKRALSDQA